MSDPEANPVTKILDLFNPEVGRRVRALLTLVAGVAVAVVALLQGVADTLSVVPKWQYLGSVALFVRTAITVLTQYTKLGEPPAVIPGNPAIVPRPGPGRSVPDVPPVFPPDSPEAG